eukprot:1161461-Pelagomonas_calceolata.AAC.1
MQCCADISQSQTLCLPLHEAVQKSCSAKNRVSARHTMPAVCSSKMEAVLHRLACTTCPLIIQPPPTFTHTNSQCSYSPTSTSAHTPAQAHAHIHTHHAMQLQHRLCRGLRWSAFRGVAVAAAAARISAALVRPTTATTAAGGAAACSARTFTTFSLARTLVTRHGLSSWVAATATAAACAGSWRAAIPAATVVITNPLIAYPTSAAPIHALLFALRRASATAASAALALSSPEHGLLPLLGQHFRKAASQVSHHLHLPACKQCRNQVSNMEECMHGSCIWACLRTACSGYLDRTSERLPGRSATSTTFLPASAMATDEKE